MRYTICLAACLIFFLANFINAQSIERQVIAASGNFDTTANLQVSWTLGETVIETFSNSSITLTQGFQQPDISQIIRLDIQVFLQGPYDESSQLMHDSLRSQGEIPSDEPYSSLGFLHIFNGGGESIDPAILNQTGDDGIVDWVFVELRDENDNSNIIATRSALVQRDGDVVDVDGSSSLSFTDLEEGNYFVAVRHRNHLGAMTQSVHGLSKTAVTIEFPNPALTTFGTEAQSTLSGVRMLWAGNVVADELLKYAGLDNDRDEILVRIGGLVPTNTEAGYYSEDANLDGNSKYAGLNNDRDIILVNIGGTISTAVRFEELP